MASSPGQRTYDVISCCENKSIDVGKGRQKDKLCFIVNNVTVSQTLNADVWAHIKSNYKIAVQLFCLCIMIISFLFSCLLIGMGWFSIGSFLVLCLV